MLAILTTLAFITSFMANLFGAAWELKFLPVTLILVTLFTISRIGKGAF